MTSIGSLAPWVLGAALAAGGSASIVPVRQGTGKASLRIEFVVPRAKRVSAASWLENGGATPQFTRRDLE